MSGRPNFFSQPNAPDKDRPSFFTPTERVNYGLPPANEPVYTSIDKETGNVMEAAKRATLPVDRQSAYVGSDEFKALFFKYAVDPESVTAEQKKQVETALDLYPQLRPIVDQVFQASRPEATMSAVTGEEAEESVKRYRDQVQKNLDVFEQIESGEVEGTVVRSPALMRYPRKVLMQGLGEIRKFADNFFGQMATRDAEGLIPLERKFQDIIHALKLEPTDPDSAYFDVTDPAGNVIERVPRSKGEVAADNFVKGLVRVQPEVVGAILKDPIGFIAALPEFVGSQVDLLAQAWTGTDIVMNSEGDIAFRAIDDKEKEQAVKELTMHPHGPALAAMLLYGTVSKIAKTGRIITTRSVMEELQRKIDDSFAEVKRKDAELTDALRRRQEAERRAAEKKQRRPVMLDESVPELSAIRKAKDGDLRSELLAMQEYAVDKLSPVDIAKLDRGELEYLISGGRIPRPEAASRATSEPVERGTVKLEDTQGALEFGEQSEVAKGRVKPEPESKEGETQKTPEEIAEENNVIFEGKRTYGEDVPEKAKTTYSFTVPDVGNGTTIEVFNLADAPKKIAEKRATGAKTPKESDAEKVAKTLKINYRGQFGGEGATPVHLFTDPKTGMSIESPNLAEIPKLVQEARIRRAEREHAADVAAFEREELERQRRQQETFDVSRETDPEIQNLMVDISQIKSRIVEQEAIRTEFEGAQGALTGTAAKNVESAIMSIDQAITDGWKDVDQLRAKLAQARAKAKQAPLPEEKEAADRVVDNALQREQEAMSESSISNTKEERAEQVAERTEAVKEKKEAEKIVEEVSESTEEALAVEAERTVVETASPKEPIPPVTEGLFEGKKQFEMTEIGELDVDTKRFQGRFEEFSEESVNSIVEDVKAGRFDPDNFDPIHVWRDPESGQSFVLAGHSRFEALKRLGQEKAPVIFRDFKTADEAIRYATELSNRLATQEGLRADVRAFRRMRDRGATPEELQARFKKNANYYDALSYLNPNGKIMDIVEQRQLTDFPLLEKWARTIGELRRDFPQLTNRHEQQIWDELYSVEKGGLYDKINKPDLVDAVQQQITDAFWTPELPIKLRYDPKPMVGPRARKDTGPVMAEIERLEGLKRELYKLEKPNAEQIKNIDEQIKKTKDALGDILKNQMGLELGFFGTPQAYVDLWISMDRALRDTGGYLGEIVKRSKMADELKPGFEGAIEGMKQHHRNLNNARFYQQVMAKQFNDLIRDPVRRGMILDMHQIDNPYAYANWLKKEKGIIIDPADYSIEQLTPFEQGVLEWLRKERDRVEAFKIDNELVEPRRMPPGVKYGFQWWINEETGKPFGIEYGRFTKSLPQAKERTFNTYLEGRLAGKTPATDNVGTLIGKDFELAMRAHAGRELYKTLNDLELGTGQALADVAEIAQGVVPGGAEIRPAMFLENWLKAKESALADEYIRLDVPFLEKPIKFKDAKGKTRTLEGPIAVHESIAPWVQAYFDNPTMNRLVKLMTFAKSMKLAGVFHATQLVVNDFMIGRFPLTDILKARKIKYDISDPSLKMLVEEGLRIEGYEDLGWDPVAQLEFEGKGLKNKLPHYILSPIRELSKFTFHTVGNNLKVGVAYSEFLKLNERWQSKVGPDLTVEQARRKAARDAVKFADNLFSHEDWRMAMLESSRNMVRFYYSTTARSALHSLLISPQWQKQHIEAFAKGIKSLNPASLLHDIQNGLDTPNANLYRRYMAGIAASFAIMDMYNYTTTLSQDGEGKHLWQNPEGHQLFHVRAPFNHPDGTEAYIRPFKTAFEVPEMLVAAGKAAYNVGQSALGKEANFDMGEIRKFTNKLNPWWAASTGTFVFNVDQFGNKIYERRGLPERIGDFLVWTYEPISISQVVETVKRHKAPVGSILSLMGMPVSKGYPGGVWNKELKDFLADERLDKEEMLQVVDDKIVAGLSGKDGELMSAMLIMREQLNMSAESIKGRLEKHRDPLVKSYDNLSQMDRAAWFMHLQETGELEAFLEAIEKDLEN